MTNDIQWNDALDEKGHAAREFRITRQGKRDVTGALWLPDSKGQDNTLMCFGHGASGTRYQAPISYLAGRFVSEQRGVARVIARWSRAWFTQGRGWRSRCLRP